MFRPRHNQQDFFAVDVGHDTCGVVCIFPPLDPADDRPEAPGRMTGAGANAATRGEIQPTMPVSRTYALFTDTASRYRRSPSIGRSGGDSFGAGNGYIKYDHRHRNDS